MEPKMTHLERELDVDNRLFSQILLDIAVVWSAVDNFPVSVQVD